VTPRNRCLVGDARGMLARLAPASVDCVITSPLYYLLRNYQVAGQLGLEPTVTDWVDELVSVVRQISRVLKPAGSLWLNLGDSYSRHLMYGASRKSLLLGPERVLLALASDGWVVRNKLVWAKSNPRPASVTDRLTCSWEPIFFLTRSPSYYFDLDAIRMPTTSPVRSGDGGRVRRAAPQPTGPPAWAGPLAGSQAGLWQARSEGRSAHPIGKNPGDVWTLASSNFRGAHFATFPEQLVARPLLATCPERICIKCGRAWQRTVRRLGQLAVRGQLQPACRCRASWQPGLVLDPFMGSGTVGVVAERLARDWLGIELNPAFGRLANERIDAARTASRRATA